MSFKLNVVQFTHTCCNDWKSAAEFGICEKNQLKIGANLLTNYQKCLVQRMPKGALNNMAISGGVP